MQKTTLILVFLLYCFMASAEEQRLDSNYLDYIDTYKQVALAQQEEYGIPAAITLAQGLLESGAGRSELATQANNHFGIKCTSDWKWETYYHDDDKENECFRKYYATEDSFIDHSLFLRNRKRYASLFELAADDYKGWARGLSRCGYATDPNYPQKLIDLIERYDLQNIQ